MSTPLRVVLLFGITLDAILGGSVLTGFHHQAWTSENGVGAVFDIQQAPNGYLWLTTSKGVFRFDGVTFRSVAEVTNGAVQTRNIDTVYASRSGGIWLATRSAGLLLWKSGKLTAYTDRRCTPALKSAGVWEDRDGWLWIQGAAGLYRTNGPVCEPIDSKWDYPGGFPSAVFVDGNGRVWVKRAEGPVLLCRRGEHRFIPIPEGGGPTAKPGYFHQAPDGSVWLSDDQGLRCLTCTNPPKLRVGQGPGGPGRLGDFSFGANGSIWAVTNEGIVHFDDAGESPGKVFGVAQGLSSDAVWKTMVDAEGMVWTGTNSGLDRLRRNTIRPAALPRTQERQFGIAAGDDGAVWTGNSNLPLTKVLSDGRIISFPQTSKVSAVRRDLDGQIWSAGGLMLWRPYNGGLTRLHYPREEIEEVVSIAVDRNREPWISTVWANVHHLERGVWRNQNQALGKRPGVLGAMRGDDSGNVWFAFSKSVVKWDGSRYHKFSFGDAALDISVTTIGVRGEHVWLGGTGGILLFTSGAFRLMKWRDPDGPGRVSGVLETASGDLWVNGFSGVTHVRVAELNKWLQNPEYPVAGDRLDVTDGLPGLSGERVPEPSIVEAPGGRIWIATTKGIAWLDPQTFEKEKNALAPPVAVESVHSNGRTFPTFSDDLQLPAGTRSMEVQYTALSMAMPERVLFRYRLEGVDEDWQEAGTRRRAFYTRLRPGDYRFQVIASNEDGVWNLQGATLDVRILPAWHETSAFYGACALMAVGLAWVLYRLRVRSVEAALNARFSARLDERLSVARNLHDTVLQTIQASHLLASSATIGQQDPAAMQAKMERLATWLRQATQEARAAVTALRSAPVTTDELAESLRQTLEAAAERHHKLAIFHLSGTGGLLHPVVCEEAMRIGGEAIRNACAHSTGTRVEVQLLLDRELTLIVRDNGAGMSEDAIVHGREGHYGLASMRERAALIGGGLSIANLPQSGLEVRLTVPGAFRLEATPGIWSRIRALWQKTPPSRGDSEPPSGSSAGG